MVTETVDVAEDNKFIVLFNGPPRSGKTTIADELARSYAYMNGGALAHFAFAHELKERTCAFFKAGDWQQYEEAKDTPMAAFMGMSPRQAYIWMSEKVIKSQFGEAVFGTWLLSRMRKALCYRHMKLSFVSDHGFAKEATPLMQAYSVNKVMIVRLRRDGCDFSNDSRRYTDYYEYERDLFMISPRIEDIYNEEGLRHHAINKITRVINVWMQQTQQAAE